MTMDTTVPSYWLNWRFLLCGIWLLATLAGSTFVIWKYEGRKKQSIGEQKGCLYEDQVWGTCSKSIHPIWLLAYRIFCFLALVAIVIADVITRGGGIFYFYTQWTFMIVTVYFGLASASSIYGCLKHHNESATEINHVADSERGENGESSEVNKLRNEAPAWGYALTITYSMCAGATVLTDAIFWLVLYPFLTPEWYMLSFIIVSKHSLNAVFLIGDTCLNRLKFPFFRIAYFALFTCVFVLCQWIIHAFVSLAWPYPFLDLSTPFAPLWYLGVGLLHFPCFGAYTFVCWIKRRIVSRKIVTDT